jgi:hypothetical protein
MIRLRKDPEYNKYNDITLYLGSTLEEYHHVHHAPSKNGVDPEATSNTHALHRTTLGLPLSEIY